MITAVGLSLGELVSSLDRDVRRDDIESHPEMFLRVFERWCAAEQVLADSDAPLEVLDSWRRTAVDLAGACFGLGGGAPWRSSAGDALAITATSDPVGTGNGRELSWLTAAVPAECLTSWPVDLTTYAALAVAAVRKLPPAESAIVVGIRTSGSYLGPVWAAALRTEPDSVFFTTVRPRRGQPFPEIPGILTFLDQHVAAARPRVLVVDDGVETGATVSALHAAVRAAGITPEQIVYVINQEIRLNGIPPGARSWWSSSAHLVCARSAVPGWPATQAAALDFFAAAVDSTPPSAMQFRVERVEAAPLSYWQSFLSAHVSAPPETLLRFDFRRRKHRYLLHGQLDGRTTTLVAKYIGFGLFAEAERRRFMLLADHGPVSVGILQGFLLYEWLAGESLDFRSGLESNADTKSVAAYTALAASCAVVGMWPLAALRKRTMQAVEQLAHRYPEVAVNVAIARLRSSRLKGVVPVVRLPRNQGYWHHLRTPSGQLMRLHLDVSDWPRECDVAEELAAVFFELGLTRDARSQLVTSYLEASGDHDVSRRLDLAIPVYLSRVLRDFDEYETKASGLISRCLTRDEEVLAPYAHRKEQIAVAFAAWAGGDFECDVS